MTPLEKEFLEESRAHAGRQRRRKRRILATVMASLAMLSLLLASLAVFAFIQMERADSNATQAVNALDKAEERSQEADAARLVSVAAKVEAVNALDKAEERRKEAEAARQTSVTALDSLTDAADDILANAPQLEEKQEKLLKDALSLREAMLDERALDASMRRKLARDVYRLAKARFFLMEFARSQELYERALRLLGEEDQEERHLLAVVLTGFGDLLLTQGKAKEARAQLHKARSLQERLENEDTKRSEFKLEAARTFNILGLVDMEDDLEGAKIAFDQCLLRLRQLLNTDPSNRDYVADVSRALVNLGVWHDRKNQDEEAVQCFKDAIAGLEAIRKNAWQRAVEILQPLAQKLGTPEDNSLIGETLQNLGSACYFRDDFKQARSHFMDVIRYQEKAQKASADNALYRSLLLRHVRATLTTCQRLNDTAAVEELRNDFRDLLAPAKKK